MKSTSLMFLAAFGSAISFCNTIRLSVSFAKYVLNSDSMQMLFLTAFVASFSFMLLVLQLVIFCREFCKFLASDDK